jgi:hypothetical protein
MQPLLVITGVFLAVAVIFYVYRRMQEMRERRIYRNEYRTAVTIWDFARAVKGNTDEMIRQRTEVLDFTKIMIPHGVGYRISLELTAPQFRIYGIPDRYNKTGRLSFYADNTLTVRAYDHSGRVASESDPEYTGDDPPAR